VFCVRSTIISTRKMGGEGIAARVVETTFLTFNLPIHGSATPFLLPCALNVRSAPFAACCIRERPPGGRGPQRADFVEKLQNVKAVFFRRNRMTRKCHARLRFADCEGALQGRRKELADPLAEYGNRPCAAENFSCLRRIRSFSTKSARYSPSLTTAAKSPETAQHRDKSVLSSHDRFPNHGTTCTRGLIGVQNTHNMQEKALHLGKSVHSTKSES